MVHHVRRFIPIVIMGIGLIALTQLSGVSAHAEAAPSSQAITVSPASTEVSIDPGSSVTKNVDVINSGSQAFNVKLTSAPYYVSGENYDPHFTQLPGTVDASQWIHLSVTDSSVAGYKVLSVPYTINVPKNTAPGGYYAVVFAETSTNNATSGVISHNRVGDILYITVNGSIKNGGNLTGDPLPSISFFGSIPIGAKITNSGGSHFITKATYTVTDMTGKKVFSATTERYILPQTQRDISSPWTTQSLFGIFTVHRSATIAGETKTLPDQKILIINPWVLAAAAFIIGIIIGVPLQRARRRRNTQGK